MERASKSGKGIVVEFSASWCPSCDRFEAVVYPTAEVQAILRELEFVRYDVERNQDPGYPRRLGFRGALPLFVALDAAGVVRGRFTGLPDNARDAAEVLRQAAMLCASEGRIRSLEAGAGDAETLLWVARWYRARGRIREAAVRIDRALSLPSVPDDLRAALQKAREDPLLPARE
ncbi:MAG: thioredoxin family protein [Deltaproteobacteria bacterium]|nr:thioredoxin family protein [Deltaproteobacteria bacterium]